MSLTLKGKINIKELESLVSTASKNKIDEIDISFYEIIDSISINVPDGNGYYGTGTTIKLKEDGSNG